MNAVQGKLAYLLAPIEKKNTESEEDRAMGEGPPENGSIDPGSRNCECIFGANPMCAKRGHVRFERKTLDHKRYGSGT